MSGKVQKMVWWGIALVLLSLLAACGSTGATGSGNTSTSATTTATKQATVGTGGATTTASTPVASATKPSGPLVIATPTPVAGGNGQGQQVTLADRVLVISNVAKQTGSNAGLVAISMMVSVENTGTNAIPNKAIYFQLVGAEGDVFGLPAASSNSPLFGTITAGSMRSGTIVFQIPSGAASGLRLLFRSEVAGETVFVTLHV